MPLQPFSFPLPETRFFQTGNLIYKFKIRGGSSFSEDEVQKGHCFNQELEDIIRTVLGNLDCLEPFSTPHYIVSPYRKPWGKVCKHNKRKLRFYPFVIILYLEKNLCSGEHTEEHEVTHHIPGVFHEPQSKRCRKDSPLEEAILKELTCNTEVYTNIPVTGQMELDHQQAAGEVYKDPVVIDKPETTHDTPDRERPTARPGILKQLIRNLFPFIFTTPESSS